MANEVTVTSINDSAQARNASGQLRSLQVGDTLFQGDMLLTPSGGEVQLTLSDGTPLLVKDLPEIAITGDLVAEAAAGRDESAAEDETVQAVLSALESGEDLGEVLEPTAAGPQVVDLALDGGGSSSFEVARRVLEPIDDD